MNLQESINKNYDHLYKISLQACSFNEDLAYDLLHETIWLIYEYYNMDKIEEKYKSESDKVNYIVRCIKNQRYGKYSHFNYKYMKGPFFQELDDNEDIVDEVEEIDHLTRLENLRKRLDAALKNFTFFERFLFSELYEKGKNINQIGKYLGVPRGKIYKSTYEMQDKLNKLLSEE